MTSNEINAALNLRFCAWAHIQRSCCPVSSIDAAIEYLRRRAIDDMVSAPEQVDAISLDAAAINSALMVVQDRDRRVVVAFYLVAQGTTAKRAASDLGLPRATFYRELARARTRVAALADQIAAARSVGAETLSQNLGKVSMAPEALVAQD